MHFSTLVAVVASLASAAVSSASPDPLPFLNDALLDKRDLTPEAKRCHKSCGYTIMGATKQGYCKDPAWRELQEACNQCAPTQDNIAQDYHDKLQDALTPCHLEAPAISGDKAQPSSAAPSSSAAAQPTSAAVVQPSSPVQESSARVGPSSAGQESSVAVVVPTSTGSGNLVSSTSDTTVSATATSSAGGSQANASTTARPSSPVSGDARSSYAVTSSSLVAAAALLLAAAML